MIFPSQVLENEAEIEPHNSLKYGQSLCVNVLDWGTMNSNADQVLLDLARFL
jgi:hypothetical protein